MAYRLYALDGEGHVVYARLLSCATDAEAIALMRTYKDGLAMELWKGDELVRRFDPATDEDGGP
jgi:hypothetical protein